MKYSYLNIPCVTLKRYITDEAPLHKIFSNTLDPTCPEVSIARYTPITDVFNTKPYPEPLKEVYLNIERFKLIQQTYQARLQNYLETETSKLLISGLVSDAKQHFNNLEELHATKELAYEQIVTLMMNGLEDYSNLVWVRLKPKHWALLTKDTLSNYYTNPQMSHMLDSDLIRYTLSLKSVVMKPHLMPKCILRR